MFSSVHTPSPEPSAAWTRRRNARRLSILRWGAALPILAVIATLRGTGPAAAQDSVVPAPQVEAPVEARWSIDNAKALLATIEDSRKEGLNPSDYAAGTLRDAIAAGQKGPALDRLATQSALRLAHDYADGRVTDKASFDWHIADPMDSAAITSGLDKAIADNRVGAWLNSLLPSNDQYRALRAAYAETDPGDAATLERLRTNLERWRWMPRKLGDHYLYVNIPTYELAVMEDGERRATYNVVVGAPETPTPQLAIYAQSVVVNPAWNLPPSVLKEGKVRPGAAAARNGYSFSRRQDGSVAIKQAPGPRNALGRIKFDMPNPYAIYLHDTPNKAAFGRTSRALSHGCVRVQNIDELAASLRGADEIGDALADKTTKTLQLEKSIPVYIVYFTAQADADGTIRYLPDPYARDMRIASAMGSKMQFASR